MDIKKIVLIGGGLLLLSQITKSTSSQDSTPVIPQYHPDIVVYPIPEPVYLPPSVAHGAPIPHPDPYPMITASTSIDFNSSQGVILDGKAIGGDYWDYIADIRTRTNLQRALEGLAPQTW